MDDVERALPASAGASDASDHPARWRLARRRACCASRSTGRRPRPLVARKAKLKTLLHGQSELLFEDAITLDADEIPSGPLSLADALARAAGATAQPPEPWAG